MVRSRRLLRAAKKRRHLISPRWNARRASSSSSSSRTDAETGENSLPTGSEFAPGNLLSAFGSLVVAPGIREIGLAPGLRGCDHPTSQPGTFGLSPTLGARCRLSWCARANAKDGGVDGEEPIVLADFHDEVDRFALTFSLSHAGSSNSSLSLRSNHFTSRRMADRIDFLVRRSVSRPERWRATRRWTKLRRHGVIADLFRKGCRGHSRVRRATRRPASGREGTARSGWPRSRG